MQLRKHSRGSTPERYTNLRSASLGKMISGAINNKPYQWQTTMEKIRAIFSNLK
jgi:hypothetical protein